MLVSQKPQFFKKCGFLILNTTNKYTCDMEWKMLAEKIKHVAQSNIPCDNYTTLRK